VIGLSEAQDFGRNAGWLQSLPLSWQKGLSGVWINEDVDAARIPRRIKALNWPDVPRRSAADSTSTSSAWGLLYPSSQSAFG